MPEVKMQNERTFRVLVNNQPYEITLSNLVETFRSSLTSLFGCRPPAPQPVIPNPAGPTLRGSLTSLLLQPAEISTPFATLTGTLINVQADYVTLVEADGSLVYIRIEQIETVGRPLV